jgi:hypothetical protein
MKNVVLLGVGLAALGLAGCDQLFKVSSPQRKPGLWEQTVQSDRTPAPLVSQWCFDAASDRRTPVLPKGPRRAGACSKFQVSKSGDAYVVDSVCSFGGGSGPSLTSHAVISGDFSAKYTIVSTVTVANASDPARNGEHKTTVTAVYKGACPPEIAAGQVQLPSGDIVDMASLRGFGRGGGGGGGPGGGGQGAGGPPAGNSAPGNSAPGNSAPGSGGQ